MTKKIISTERAPAAIGPYSQAVKTDSLVFVSGQVPINPETGEVVTGSIKDEVRQVLRNLNEILKASGSSIDKVVKTTVYLTNMDEFMLMNEVYCEFFKENPPARACVEVSMLPKNVNVEIDAIAAL